MAHPAEQQPDAPDGTPPPGDVPAARKDVPAREDVTAGKDVPARKDVPAAGKDVPARKPETDDGTAAAALPARVPFAQEFPGSDGPPPPAPAPRTRPTPSPLPSGFPSPRLSEAPTERNWPPAGAGPGHSGPAAQLATVADQHHGRGARGRVDLVVVARQRRR